MNKYFKKLLKIIKNDNRVLLIIIMFSITLLSLILMMYFTYPYSSAYYGNCIHNGAKYWWCALWK